MTPEVILTGDAVRGHIVDHLHAQALILAELPVKVKLGRRPPTRRCVAPHLSDFLDTAILSLPSSTNWRLKAAPSLARMYLNDQYGDCVIASNIHGLGVTSANDPDSSGTVLATDQEVLSMYHTICGPGDNGCVIEDTLAYGVQKGWTAGGKHYKLDAYAAVDWTNWDLLRACCHYFGGFKIGINLPEEWTSASTWDTTGSRIVGGHDVRVIDFDSDYLYLSSWGRIYRLTKRAALSTRWLEEAWAVLDGTWYGPDKQSPAGFNIDGLKAALAAIHAGHVPDDPGPTPPTPPPPPPPPPPEKHMIVKYPGGTFPVTVQGPFGGVLHGSVTIPGATLPVVEGNAGPLEARDWSRIVQAILNGERRLCPLVPFLAMVGVPPDVVAALKVACSLVPPAAAESPCDCA